MNWFVAHDVAAELPTVCMLVAAGLHHNRNKPSVCAREEIGPGNAVRSLVPRNLAKTPSPLCRSLVRLVVRSLVPRKLAKTPSPLCRSLVRLVVRSLVPRKLAKKPSPLCRSLVRLVVRALVPRKLAKTPWPLCRSLVRLVGRCLLYTSPSPRDRQKSRMPSSA